MAITRDEGFPPEIASLMQAFNHCADGHSAGVVLNASLQMVAAGIGFICKEQKRSLAETEEYTSHIAGILHQIVTDNWNRKPTPLDIEVKFG